VVVLRVSCGNLLVVIHEQVLAVCNLWAYREVELVQLLVDSVSLLNEGVSPAVPEIGNCVCFKGIFEVFYRYVELALVEMTSLRKVLSCPERVFFSIFACPIFFLSIVFAHFEGVLYLN